MYDPLNLDKQKTYLNKNEKERVMFECTHVDLT